MIDCDKLKTGQTEADCTVVRGNHSHEKTVDVLVSDGCAVIRINNWLGTNSSHFRPDNCSLIRFTADELRKMADAVEAFDAKQQEKPIRCYFCQTSTPTVNEAIEAGWIPSFYDGIWECSTPVCSKCVSKHTEWNNEFGDFQLKKE
jgi:hypothetical protein